MISGIGFGAIFFLMNIMAREKRKFPGKGFNLSSNFFI